MDFNSNTDYCSSKNLDGLLSKKFRFLDDKKKSDSTLRYKLSSKDPQYMNLYIKDSNLANLIESSNRSTSITWKAAPDDVTAALGPPAWRCGTL